MQKNLKRNCPAKTNTIIVINKNDLEEKIDISNLNSSNIIYINTIEEDGIDSLKEKYRIVFELFYIKILKFVKLVVF